MCDFALTCCAQLDKATADASEFKAGYDKVLADSVEQKAQVRPQQGWQHRVLLSPVRSPPRGQAGACETSSCRLLL